MLQLRTLSPEYVKFLFYKEPGTKDVVLICV
jgi:hypothetical protein